MFDLVPKNILEEYALKVEKILSNTRIDDYRGMLQNLALLKRLILNLATTLVDQCSPEQADALAVAPWPVKLSIPKLTLFDNALAAEQSLLASVAFMYAEGPGTPNFAKRFLLGRLLLLPYRITHECDWSKIPQPYLKNFILFQFETLSPTQIGDSEKFCRHMENLLASMLKFVDAPKTSPDDRMVVLDIFYNQFNPSTLTMSPENARPIMELRYKLLKRSIELYIHSELDWTPPPRNPEKKIRLGLCAGSLLTGSETVAMLAKIGQLDRSKYEIILFFFDLDMNYYSDISYFRELLEKIDDLVPLRMKDFRKCVELFRQKNLDLLWHQSHVGLSLASHPVALTFMHRLARRQVFNTVMHAHTTGNPNFQYILNLAPPALPKTWEGEYSEIEINVPGIPIYIPDHWHDEPNKIIRRESLDIPADGIIYFSGSAAEKYNAEMMITWLSILAKVPNSYLVVYPFNPTWYPRTDNIIAYYARLYYACSTTGVSPDRIKVLGHVNGEAIAQMMHWGHIHLSSFPYGGVTTLSDALRGNMGVVCYRGKYSRSNGDASIMAAYGLLDLCATSMDDYVEKAVQLGTDPAYLAATKKRIQTAWDTCRPSFREHIARVYAAAIDDIVARENNFLEDSNNQPARYA